MTEITLQGNKINTNAEIPEVGGQAPDFTLVDSELNNVNLSSYKGKNIVLNIIPSLDTPVCQKSTKIFNERVAAMNNVVVLAVSADLPFAMKRFCTSENINSVIPLSMMRSRNFAKDYGVLLVDGPLSGITARAVVVINKNNEIIHSELVNEIANEPNYDDALDCIS
ncbi:MAG: thiol peroxidase [Gammaproteobacteria bacterium]|jgi:thioredoxin-dependent peroxiredoxin|nr:thiol peroxidase [Gammaproteobacteria bacterium]MBT5406285.1 thiol peroxidase [Gammaproteobacteria bacterium]MBT6734515.1 thiol peroxidase [Gammaproteobacteria bacterium]MBT7236392.1 thiol peroxidase [Gammaproteobacteria bacterium]|tara:strand:- start:7824 stop:8324 length:501 start_codon:yes stop_codon:yes gene_type:complete